MNIQKYFSSKYKSLETYAIGSRVGGTIANVKAAILTIPTIGRQLAAIEKGEYLNLPGLALLQGCVLWVQCGLANYATSLFSSEEPIIEEKAITALNIASLMATGVAVTFIAQKALIFLGTKFERPMNRKQDAALWVTSLMFTSIISSGAEGVLQVTGVPNAKAYTSLLVAIANLSTRHIPLSVFGRDPTMSGLRWTLAQFLLFSPAAVFVNRTNSLFTKVTICSLGYLNIKATFQEYNRNTPNPDYTSANKPVIYSSLIMAGAGLAPNMWLGAVGGGVLFAATYTLSCVMQEAQPIINERFIQAKDEVLSEHVKNLLKYISASNGRSVFPSGAAEVVEKYLS